MVQWLAEDSALGTSSVLYSIAEKTVTDIWGTEDEVLSNSIVLHSTTEDVGTGYLMSEDSVLGTLCILPCTTYEAPVPTLEFWDPPRRPYAHLTAASGASLLDYSDHFHTIFESPFDGTDDDTSSMAEESIILLPHWRPPLT